MTFRLLKRTSGRHKAFTGLDPRRSLLHHPALSSALRRVYHTPLLPWPLREIADPAEAQKVTGSVAIARQSFSVLASESPYSGWAARSFQDKDGDFCDGYPNTLDGKNTKLSDVGFPPSFDFKELGDDHGHAHGSRLPTWPCRYLGMSELAIPRVNFTVLGGRQNYLH